MNGYTSSSGSQNVKFTTKMPYLIGITGVENSPSSAPEMGLDRIDAIAPENRIVRTKTPPVERKTSNWTGLPSPDTPSFGNKFHKSLPIHLEGSNEDRGGRTGGRATKVTEQAHIAPKPAKESPNHKEALTYNRDDSSIAAPVLMRRSTRVRKQVLSYSMHISILVQHTADTSRRFPFELISKHTEISQDQACGCGARFKSFYTVRVNDHASRSRFHSVRGIASLSVR